MDGRTPIKLFGLNATKSYAEKVAAELGVALTPHEEKEFEDGECYVKPIDGPEGNVRGHGVFVIQSLYSDDKESVNDKFMKLATMLTACRSTASLTVVIPHLCFARQDRKTESRAPVMTKAIAVMLESLGISGALLFDVHNLAAEQNAFSMNCTPDNLEAKTLFADWAADELIRIKSKKASVLSPDSSALPRNIRFLNGLQKKMAMRNYQIELEIAVLDKLRSKNKIEGGKRIIGDVEGADVFVLDDMISTGGTMTKACKAVPAHGGRVHALMATHGLFVGDANDHLAEVEARIVVTDTVDPFRLNSVNQKKLVVLSTAKMMANAIKRIHSGTGSISELLR
jgi:ribose-phosphate pyrophosphokinase